MRVMIDIPKEFETDLQDNFNEFFERVKCDINSSLESQEISMCGNYERETAEMFLSAFEKATVIPDDATNKNVICALYPDTILEVTEDRETFDNLSTVSLLMPKQTVEWWNAPYKKEVEE